MKYEKNNLAKINCVILPQEMHCFQLFPCFPLFHYCLSFAHKRINMFMNCCVPVRFFSLPFQFFHEIVCDDNSYWDTISQMRWHHSNGPSAKSISNQSIIENTNDWWLQLQFCCNFHKFSTEITYFNDTCDDDFL